MRPVTIILLGEPVPFARAGANGSQRFTPKRQRNAAAAIRIEAQQAMQAANPGLPPFAGPVSMDLSAEFAIPQSWSRRKQAMALAGEVMPAKRPDTDNLLKLAADAFNQIIYCDDAQIVQVRARKVYSTQPKLIATVTAL